MRFGNSRRWAASWPRMLSRQWPRPISTNAIRYDHHVLSQAAAITTPNVCTMAITTVMTLRTVGMRRSSSRSGRVGMARALRRSVGRTSGSRSSGGTMVLRATVAVMRPSYIHGS